MVDRQPKATTGTTLLSLFLLAFVVFPWGEAAFQLPPRRRRRLRRLSDQTNGPPADSSRSTFLTIHANHGSNHHHHSKSGASGFEQTTRRPIPVMPSRVFQELAQSQLELLANSLLSSRGGSKVKTTALYLPQENAVTGQLEFTPAILYPLRDRVFIASDADSGVAPTLPPSLTKLPGFSHAKALMPGYPMVSSDSSTNDSDNNVNRGGGSVGIVEEVLCDVQRVGSCALSVPLFSGLETVGVLLVSPADVEVAHYQEQQQQKNRDGSTLTSSLWTEHDKQQVSRAAKSLALALSMDHENKAMVDQNQQIAQSLSDSMHQLKNPLQALRTYSKLLQRQIANDENGTTASIPNNNNSNGSSQRRLLQLADHLMVQSDRIAQRLSPVDTMVEKLASAVSVHDDDEPQHLFLLPAQTTQSSSTPSSSLLALSSSVSASTNSKWTTPLAPIQQQQKKYRTKRVSDPSQDPSRMRSRMVSSSSSLSNAVSSRNTNRMSPKYRSSSPITTAARTIDSTITLQMTRQPPPPPQKDETKTTGNRRLLPLEMAFVPDVLEPVLETFSVLAEEQGIDFQVENDNDELPGVHMHVASFQEVMTNLLDNAFKYSVLGQNKEPPTVKLVLRSNHPLDDDDRASAGVTLYVTDNGPGIPQTDDDNENEAMRVFQRGYRCPSTQHQTSGQGLGLAIAQELVQAMEGNLRVVWPKDKKDDDYHPDNLLDGATFELKLWRKRVLPKL